MQHPSSSLEVSFLQIKVNNVCDDMKRLSEQISIAFSLFHWDLFMVLILKTYDFHRCSIRCSIWGNPEGHCLCSTGLWCEDLPKTHSFVHRLSILTCSTSYCFYSAVYSGLQLLPCCRGKQSSKFQATVLSLGFYLSCCSFWSSIQRKITASLPCAVLQVHSYTTTKELGVRVWLLFSLFACPCSGLSLFFCISLANPQCSHQPLKVRELCPSFTEKCTVTIMLVSGLQMQHQLAFLWLLSPYNNTVSLNFHLQGVPGSI